MLSGPPGIGKSALLRRTVDQAAALGLAGRCRRRRLIEGAWAYAPLLDAVADLCRRQPALLDGLADPYRHEIDRVLAGVEAPWTGQSTHQRLFVAVAELLRLASATTGVVLALDDLHDADEATLRLLHYLSRALAEARVLLLVAHRTTVPMPAMLDQLRAGLLGRHGGIELELAALGRDAARADRPPRARTPPPSRWSASSTLAGGNPYVAIELADPRRRRADVGGRPRRPRRRRHPPDDPGGAAACRRRGLHFDIDEFVALSGLPDDDAFAHLDHAVALRILEPADAGYRFRHRLVRDALLERPARASPPAHPP